MARDFSGLAGCISELECARIVAVRCFGKVICGDGWDASGFARNDWLVRPKSLSQAAKFDAPTLLDMLGVAKSAEMTGKSLLVRK